MPRDITIPPLSPLEWVRLGQPYFNNGAGCTGSLVRLSRQSSSTRLNDIHRSYTHIPLVVLKAPDNGLNSIFLFRVGNTKFDH